jgi:two-component system cell cycle response regulator
MLLDELKLREETSRELGIEATSFLRSDAELFRGFGVAVVMDDASDAAELCAMLPSKMETCPIIPDADGALAERIAGTKPDLIIVDMRLGGNDALRLAVELRSREATRFSSILLLAEQSEQSRLAKAFELGVNDYLVKPVDPSELIARVRTQARYRRYRDRLHGAYSESVNQAHTDALTGLFNRRYVMRHIDHLRAGRRPDAEPIAAMMIDIDHFKAVNDAHGHDVGDVVLKEIAARLRASLRPGDVVARLGGEEFLVVLPTADRALALSIAERLRKVVADQPIALPGSGQSIGVTVSVGVTLDRGQDVSLDELLKQADDALYQAKREGRNRVIFSQAVSAAA